MKKQVCLLTIISMLLCLTACAAQPESSKSNSSSQPVTESSTQISEESSNSSGEESRTQPETLTGPSTPHRDGYTLEQVVVLSRHNIRSPLSGGGSLLESITPHEWFHWSSQASELSMRGGILEQKWDNISGCVTALDDFAMIVMLCQSSNAAPLLQAVIFLAVLANIDDIAL